MSKSVVYSESAPEPIGPYSQAIQSGNLLFVSGQIALQRSSGVMVTTSVEEETKQVMANIKAVLTAGGMDFNNIVKTSIFLKDMNNFPVVNQIYGTYFND